MILCIFCKFCVYSAYFKCTLWRDKFYNKRTIRMAIITNCFGHKSMVRQSTMIMAIFLLFLVFCRLFSIYSQKFRFDYIFHYYLHHYCFRDVRVFTRLGYRLWNSHGKSNSRVSIVVTWEWSLSVGICFDCPLVNVIGVSQYCGFTKNRKIIVLQNSMNALTLVTVTMV